MGLKKQFLEKVQEHFPEFNKEFGSVEIEFCGGGDNFDSFHYITVDNYIDGKHSSVEGSWNMDDDIDFLFKIIDEAGCEYDFNNAGTTGKIIYEDEELRVETYVSTEYYGEVDDDEEETQN